MADTNADKKAAIQAAMDRIRSGDANGGINALDDLIGGELERYFKGKGVHANDAEGLVWKLFAKAARSATGDGGYRGDAPAEHWLNTCKKNLVIDYWRKRASNEEDVESDLARVDDEDGHGASPFDHLEAINVDHELIECIGRAFDEFRRDFPERAAHIEWLVDHWSNEEIAEALGIKLGAARDRIYQTRRKLEPYVAPCVERKERLK